MNKKLKKLIIGLVFVLCCAVLVQSSGNSYSWVRPQAESVAVITIVNGSNLTLLELNITNNLYITNRSYFYGNTTMSNVSGNKYVMDNGFGMCHNATAGSMFIGNISLAYAMGWCSN